MRESLDFSVQSHASCSNKKDREGEKETEGQERDGDRERERERERERREEKTARGSGIMRKNNPVWLIDPPHHHIP